LPAHVHAGARDRCEPAGRQSAARIVRPWAGKSALAQADEMRGKGGRLELRADDAAPNVIARTVRAPAAVKRRAATKQA